jgi:hypothetical protein
LGLLFELAVRAQNQLPLGSSVSCGLIAGRDAGRGKRAWQECEAGGY